MNQQDQRFFRQNFSASSCSSASDSQAPQATYQKASLKLKFPGWNQKQSVNIIKKLQQQQQTSQDHSLASSHKIRSDGTLLLNTEKLVRRSSQLKMLEKFKNQILGIRHMNGSGDGEVKEKGGNVHSEGEKGNREGQGERRSEEYMVNSLKDQSKYSHHGRANSFTNQQMSEILEDSRKEKRRELDEREQGDEEMEIDRVIERVHELEEIVKKKESVIKRLRRNEEELKDKYKEEIRELQIQGESSFDTITTLRKQLIQKQSQITDLKQRNQALTSTPNTYRIQRQLSLLKIRQKQLLQTIRSLQLSHPNNNSINYSFNGLSNSQVNKQPSQQLHKLTQILHQRDQIWQKRIRETMEIQRRSNIDEVQRLLVQQQQCIMQYSNVTSTYPIELHEDSVVLEGVERLIREIEQLRQGQTELIEHSLAGELKDIKQYIIRLQNNSQYYLPSQGSQLSKDRGVEISLKDQLHQYKNYVRQQQKNKKVFLQQLNLYREQNSQIIKENGYLRHQLGALQMQMKKNQSHVNIQESLSQPQSQSQNQPQSKISVQQLQLNVQYQQQIEQLRKEEEQSKTIIIELRQNVQEYQTQLTDYQRYIKDLQGELMNVSPQKPAILNKMIMGGTLEGVEEAAELHLEIQRLNSLIQTQIAQLTQVNQQKIRSYQQQIRMYQQRITIYQSTLYSNQQILQQYQSQIQQSHLKSLGGEQNQNIIVETNKQISLQNSQLKNQIGGLLFANRELQRQVKERTHAVEHLWQVKQAEFENVGAIIGKIKRSSQF